MAEWNPPPVRRGDMAAFSGADWEVAKAERDIEMARCRADTTPEERAAWARARRQSNLASGFDSSYYANR